MKNCRSCHHHKYGKCEMFDNLFSIAYPDVDVIVDGRKLAERLKGTLKENNLNLKPVATEELIDSIGRVVDELLNDVLLENDVAIVDPSDFYCKYYD